MDGTGRFTGTPEEIGVGRIGDAYIGPREPPTSPRSDTLGAIMCCGGSGRTASRLGLGCVK